MSAQMFDSRERATPHSTREECSEARRYRQFKYAIIVAGSSMVELDLNRRVAR